MTLCESPHPEHAGITCQNERDHEGEHYHEDAPYVYAWPLSYVERYRGFGSNTRPYRGKDWRNRMH